jgi:Relaxase/Mobilisation nuclease domain
MAYVSIRWGKNSAHHLNYVLKDRAENDVTYAHDCSVETAVADFGAVRAEHNQNDGNHVLHVMQSFSPLDSRRLEPDDFNAIGRRLALQTFPDHQFVVRTHTDTNQTHNHIIVNTVNSQTGKKIENKRALIQRLQDSSDGLCKEKGLSVINRESKERRARLPFKVQQMVRAGKSSYILDLSQKADVARSIATGFDEYRDILHGFGIRVLLEEKNISYFYPGRERGKRGSKLGRQYDKEGLTEAFASNQEKFARHPERKSRFLSQLAPIQQHGMPRTPEGVSRFQNLWNGNDSAWLVPTAYTKISRRDSKSEFQSDRALACISVPVSEIKRAKGNSIFEYCKRNNIALISDQHGNTVIKGKEFVHVAEFDFKNTKNGTHGSLIDLVAAHKNMTLLQAVAHINGNNRLLLLERQVGEVPPKFRSFYVPKPEKTTAAKAAGMLNAFMTGRDVPSRCRLSDFALERMGKKGGVWLFVNEQRQDFQHQVLRHEQAMFAFANANRTHGTATIHREAERTIDDFLLTNPSIKSINVVDLGNGKSIGPSVHFLSVLIEKYGKAGIDIFSIGTEKDLDLSISLAARAPERSRGRGGPSIGF